MRTALLALFVVGGVALAQDKDKPDGAAALKELQGAYTVVSLEKRGERAPEDVLGDIKVAAIRDGRFTLKVGAEEKGARLKLNPAREPKEVDMTPEDGPFKGKTLHGIYKLEGGELTFCFDEEGKQRPKEFATAKDDRRLLMTLKRVKE
jgi:uncharacterized protein (TIGR03067 family)